MRVVSAEPDIVAKIREANELAATGRYGSIEALADVVGVEASTLRHHEVSVSNYARLSTTGQAALSRFAQPAAAEPADDSIDPGDILELDPAQRAPTAATPTRPAIREPDTRRSLVARPDTAATSKRSRRNPISWLKSTKPKQRRSSPYDSLAASSDLPEPPTYSAAELAAMATDNYAGARRAAANLHNCPPAMLATLAEDDIWYIREAVAGHPRCPPRTLLLLAADSHWLVRRTVAERSDCPPRASTVLLGDWHPGVQEAAHRHRHRHARAAARTEPDPAAADGDTDRLIQALSRPDCPIETLTEAAAHDLWHVRQDAAQHPNCPPAALMLLGGDDHWIVRRTVAGHDDCPSRTLARLINDNNRTVQVAASLTFSELRTAAEITALRARRTSPNTPPATTGAAVRNPATPHTAASRHTPRSDDD